MHMHRLALAVALVAVAGCGSSPKVAVSARTGPATQALAAAGTRTALVVGATPNAIEIDRVQLAIDRIRLETVSSSDTAHAAENEEDEISLAPRVIGFDLPNTSATSPQLTTVFDAEVKPATYEEIKFRIHPVDAAVDPTMAGISVKVAGKLNGQDFVFTSALDAEQEREGTFTVGSGTQNITFAVDVGSWFFSGTTVLDPTNEANRPAIEANIKASIDAFEDDDRDGMRD